MAKRNYPDPGDTDTNNVVSSTECTGLVQTPPQNKEQKKSYNEIYET